MSRGSSSVAVLGLLTAAASLAGVPGSGVHGLTGCSSRAQAQWLWHMDLVAAWHAGASWTRD